MNYHRNTHDHHRSFSTELNTSHEPRVHIPLNSIHNPTETYTTRSNSTHRHHYLMGTQYVTINITFNLSPQFWSPYPSSSVVPPKRLFTRRHTSERMPCPCRGAPVAGNPLWHLCADSGSWLRVLRWGSKAPAQWRPNPAIGGLLSDWLSACSHFHSLWGSVHSSELGSGKKEKKPLAQTFFFTPSPLFPSFQTT